MNVFAIVIYIPDPLRRFLDELRRELVPDYQPHAHVSVLPPRPLPSVEEWEGAREEARAKAESWSPFRVEATGVSIFPDTDVVYLELGAGSEALRAMHRALNSGRLAWTEPFPYHPHITLAQDISRDRVPAVYATAQQRWSEFTGDKEFLAESAVFVCNTLDGRWLDLAEFSFGAVPASRR